MKRFYVIFILVGLFNFLATQASLSEAHAQSPALPSFAKTLKRGMRGEEVRNLQIALAHPPIGGPEIYPEGLITGYFGALTEAAVQRFQAKNNIISSGFPSTTGFGLVGPKTRSSLNKLSAGPLPPKEPVGTTKPTAPTQPTLTPKEKPYFSYRWRANDSLTGEVNFPTPVERPVIILSGEKSMIPRNSPALRLAEVHKIILSDEEEQWDEEKAAMLLETIQPLKDILYKQGYKKSWKVILTKAELQGDREIIQASEGDQAGLVKISQAVFKYANPIIQSSGADTSKKIFYSNRLYRAVLGAFFNERKLLETILKERYGVAAGYAEPRDEFQDFYLEELQYLATVFEDLPLGFRHIPGLEKVVRRKNGLTNPWSPQAPAIAWVGLGYIEFMDIAFRANNEDYSRRLIAHEMTHFVWHKILKTETKEQFMKSSGWSLTVPAGGIKADSGKASDYPKGRVAFGDDEIWYRTTTTNFASDYAAAHNPDEDFAETVSYYIYLPDKVRTFAPEKYNFVKNVVDGYEYAILVDAKYTFQVFNLHPDTTFPGKIVGTDIEVYKTDDGSNKVIMTLSLSSQYGDGAEEAYARLFSPQDTYFDIYFYPVEGDKFKLRSEFIIPKTAANGYWLPDQITVTDRVDNRRQEGQAQFGWLLYINNPKEDLKPPVPDINRISSTTETIEGDHFITIFVPVTDEYEEGLYGYAELHQYEANQSVYDYADYDFEKKSLVYELIIRKYHAAGQWTFREFSTTDLAENGGRYDLKEKELVFSVITEKPDRQKPVLDFNAIRIKAVPRRPEAPNGETDVTIWYAARDDNSGLGLVDYQLLKPTGATLFDYHYHDNFHTPYFVGDPTKMQTYEIKLTLPPGSPPGTWILQQLVLQDKAGNTLTSHFIEIGILKPFEIK
jgi:peptidoglycan hydrolase-like protein with peptidoglycan-binding domain